MKSNKPNDSFSRMRRRARQRAMQGIYQWQLSSVDVDDIYRYFIEEQDFAKVDVEYFKKLLVSVVHSVDKLDEILSPCLDRPIIEVDPIEKSILRLAAYELLECPDVPYRAVINEAIELAKTFGSDESFAYINAVLDKLGKQVRALEQTGNTQKAKT